MPSITQTKYLLSHIPCIAMFLLCRDIVIFSLHKLSERMKIVDVLGARVFKDGECLITQVHESDICCCTFELHNIGLVR